MPVYAPTPGFAVRRPHPKTLMFIVGAHAVALAAVITAKPELAEKFIPTITTVIDVDPPKPPPPEPQPPVKKVDPPKSRIDQTPVIIPIPRSDDPVIVDRTPAPPLPPTPGPIGTGIENIPPSPPLPTHIPVRTGVRFITAADQIRPPYPDDKRRQEQEASLRLRLSIDARGRVVGVEPVGPVDPSFFAAARQHLLAHWRYAPATVDGRAVAATTVITLRFELQE